MPFGRYTDVLITDLPTSYLEWLTTIELGIWLRTAVNAELQSRLDSQYHQRSKVVSIASTRVLRLDVDDLPVVNELIERGYKAAARVHHPDTGGNADRMRQLNDVAQKLRSQIGVLT
jgi:hypothetical protein